MADDLVSRLRAVQLFTEQGACSSLPYDAADALEAKDAQIARLRELLEYAIDNLEDAGYAHSAAHIERALEDTGQ